MIALSILPGTLILTVVIFQQYSLIYVILMIILNCLVYFKIPFSWLAEMESKFKHLGKPESLEEYKYKINKKKIMRGTFTAYANLFGVIRPIEEISYYSTAHMLIMQPFR